METKGSRTSSQHARRLPTGHGQRAMTTSENTAVAFFPSVLDNAFNEKYNPLPLAS
jgi:hypothetical protein